MDTESILDNRLLNQQISSSAPSTPEDAVAALGAIQAQDYPAALWAIGLRCKSAAKSGVEDAISRRRMARTWLMRGTLHFAASSDIAWMLKLFSPRLSKTAEYRDRVLGLSDESVRRTKALFREALSGGKRLTRREMYRVMTKGRVPASDNLGYHMLYRAAWDGLICFGPFEGKEPTFVLAEEWLPRTTPLEGADALREIATRYFSSHGPAALKDFVWWSGLTVSEARLGIEKAASMLRTETVDNISYYLPRSSVSSRSRRSVFLLPAFDEYLLGYSDRSAILGNERTKKWIRGAKVVVVHANGIFLPTLIVDGEVAGVWKKASSRGGLTVTLTPFWELNRKQEAEAKERVEEYGRFFGTTATSRLQD